MAGCACLLELLAEPLYILSQNLLLLKLRLMVETVATFSRCVTMYILIVKPYDMVYALIGLSLQPKFACHNPRNCIDQIMHLDTFLILSLVYIQQFR